MPLAAIAAPLFCAFALESTVEAQSVRVALVAPVSDRSNAVGREVREAIQRGIAILNERGGLLGSKVELTIRDDGDTVDAAIGVARAVIRDLAPQAVITTRTDEAVARVYNDARTVVFMLYASDVPPRWIPYGFVFHVGIQAEHLGEAAAGSVLKGRAPGASLTVGVVRDGTAFSDVAASRFKGLLEAGGAAIAFDKAIREAEDIPRLVEGKNLDVVLAAALEPTTVSRWIGNRPLAPKLMLFGMPYSTDASWEEFWSWSEEARARGTRIEVIAPASMTGDSLPRSALFEVCRDLRDGHPSILQVYALSALELVVEAVRTTGTARSDAIRDVMRGNPKPTMLGPVRSGEIGEVKPIPYSPYEDHERWSPARAFRIDVHKRQRTSVAPPDEPQYNVLVEPKVKADPLVLKPDEKTSITFEIGPALEESVVKGVAPDKLLEAISAGDEIELTVSLYSYVSDEDRFQQHRIAFDPSRGAAERAEFEITPSAKAVANTSGMGDLVFVVDAGGMEIDVLRITAFVGDPTPDALKAYRPPAKLAFESLQTGEIALPDLVISLTPYGRDGKIPIVLRPILPPLKAMLQAELGDAAADSWAFKSGLAKSDLDDLSGQTYMHLRALVEQKNSALQEVYKQVGGSTQIGPGAGLLHFTAADRDSMLESLRLKGAEIHERLFRRGGARLAKAMQAIESFAFSRPLRVRILAADVFAPWQILYPEKTGPIDPLRFWGFRYEMGTLQLVDAAQGRSKTILRKPAPGEVVFASWRGVDPSKDEVAERASYLAKSLAVVVGGAIHSIDSRDALVDAMKKDRSTIKLLFAYGHGSSGTELVVYESQGTRKLLTVPAVSGPSFLFSDKDVLTPAKIDEANPGGPSCFLAAQPFVVLNACETGTSGSKPPDNNGFVGAFTRAGARSIVVTESPVWANFAYHFGSDLIEELFKGSQAQAAIRAVRLRHLEQANNPLGLLYSLYGNPAARFEK